MIEPAANQWARVAWTDARQILELVDDWDALSAQSTPIAPQDYFAALVDKGQLREAATFLGHALPRYEGLVWAVQTLMTQSALDRADPLVIAILRWIDSPDDGLRRQIRQMADTLRDITPVKLLAMSIFMSGGSISEPELQAVLPPPSASPKLSAAAVIVAAYASDQPDAFLEQAITLGRTFAETGRSG